MAHYAQGTYDCIVVEQGFDESKTKRTPFFWLTFSPQKRDGQAIDAPYTREVRLWLTEKTVAQTVERLRGLGWNGTEFKELAAGKHSFRGANVVLRCSHSQEGDKIYENWEFPAPAGGQQSTNKAGLAMRLDALFGKALNAGVAKREPAAEMVPPDDDGAIPF